jgi:hypothetical protein
MFSLVVLDEHNFPNNCPDASLDIFCNPCYASGPSGVSSMEFSLAVVPFFHLLLFIVGSPILFF